MIPVTVTFYGDVGFDRSYNHVIDFSNETERNNYFSNKILKVVNNCAYNKPINSIQLKCPYEDALKFTYCKFIMGSNTNKQKTVYAWVDDVVLVTDQLDTIAQEFIPILEISISIDPWQTFLFDFTLGESFVAREHRDRFVANGDGTRGWCIDNTSDIVNVGTLKRMNELCELSDEYTLTVMGEAVTTSFFWILVQQVTTGTQPHVTLNFFPVTNGKKTLPAENNNGYYVLTLADMLNDDFINKIGIAANEIASIYLIPFDIGEPSVRTVGTYNALVFDFYFRDEVDVNTHEFTREYYYRQGSTNQNYLGYRYVLGVSGKTLEFNRDVEFNAIDLSVPTDNADYSPTHEPQLYKEPYFKIAIVDEEEIERAYLPSISANVIDGFKGVRLKLMVDTVSVRLRVMPLYVVETPNVVITDKQWCEFPLTAIDIISTNWYSYLVQERETARQMIASQINQQAIATAIGGVSSAVGMGGQQAMGVGKAQASGSSGAAMLTEGGAFGAGALVGLGVGAINTVGGYISNKHFAFEQQDIREKAVRMKANNVLVNGTFKSSISTKLKIVVIRCDTTTLDIKAKEFHKYGYSVFFYETPNIKSRKYFNFIATNIVKIEGSLNNNIKMALSQIFNNGVTIWHGDYISELTGIGDYSKENIERSLI